MEAKAIHEALAARFGEAIVSASLDGPSPFAVVAPEKILEVAAFVQAVRDGRLQAVEGV